VTSSHPWGCLGPKITNGTLARHFCKPLASPRPCGRPGAKTGRRHITDPPSVGDTFESSSRVWPLASSISILVSEIATRLSFRSRYPGAPPTLEVPLQLWKGSKIEWTPPHTAHRFPNTIGHSVYASKRLTRGLTPRLAFMPQNHCVPPLLSHGPTFPSAPPGCHSGHGTQ